MTVQSALVSALVTLGSLVLIAIISGLIGSNPAKLTSSASEVYLEESNRLVAESEQDKNAIVALMHSTEAIVWARALSYLTSDDNIKRKFGQSCKELEAKARASQKNALKRIKEAA